MESHPRCPYCQSPLEKVPKYRGRCPHCGNPIVVDTRQDLFDSPLLTEADARAVYWLKRLEGYGVTARDFRKAKKALHKQQDVPWTSGDVIWRLFHEIKSRLRDLHQLKMLCYSMALFLDQEHKDPTQSLRESARYELLHRKALSEFCDEQPSRTAHRVQTLPAPDSCDACKALGNRTFSIDEALVTMPLPCTDCTRPLHNRDRGFCRCEYVACVEEYP